MRLASPCPGRGLARALAWGVAAWLVAAASDAAGQPGATPAGTQPTSAQPLSAVQAGRARAAACAVCHGPLGLSSAPDAPHLAGMPVIYFRAQLRAYRSGARQHEVMAIMARSLSDDDIHNLAAWYSAIPIEARAPAEP